MQNMYIIIVLVFCVNAMAINVIANQAEYQCLSQNSRNLRCYVRSCLSKNIPRSLKVHHLATRKKSTHKTSSRFAQKMRRKTIFSGTRIVNSSMRYNNASRDTHGKKYLKYLRFFSCNFPYSDYKGVINSLRQLYKVEAP